MGKVRRRKPRRRRIGRVSIYMHHGRWWAYYREHGRPVRKAVADDEDAAATIAAQINLELTATVPTLFSFRPLSVAELQRTFIEFHEHVARSSLATVNRYRTATRHLVEFGERPGGRPLAAHEIDAEAFVRHLRTLRVAPNGHRNTRRRPLRDNGVRYILETCRSMYAYAGKRRHLPPYTENPFAGVGGKRSRIEDAKPVFVFDEETELRFLAAADRWSFAVHFLLAKTGLRVGELVRLLIEDIDFNGGWLHVRNRPELNARTKTRRERAVPLIAEVVHVLRTLVGNRQAGLVILRQSVDSNNLPLANADSSQLAAIVRRRIADLEVVGHANLDRRAVMGIQQRLWREAGATTADRIRNMMIRIGAMVDLTGLSCPKSWRHTFATLLQDANVDPLIRQQTLGHAAPTAFGTAALGMTTNYTHTRPETQHREIERALRLWPRSLELARAF